MNRFFPIIIFFILIQGCKSGIPKEIIQPDKMEKVLFDIHVVDGYINTFVNPDTTKIIASSYYNGVYEKFGIDSALFNKSMDYYYAHPVILDEIYTNVEKTFTLENEKYDQENKVDVSIRDGNNPSLIILANRVPAISLLKMEVNPFSLISSNSRY